MLMKLNTIELRNDYNWKPPFIKKKKITTAQL